METENKKVNWTRLAITTGIVLLTALTVGGSTWYVMDKNAKADKETNEKALEAMQNQIDGLNKLEEKTAVNSENTYKNSEYGFELTIPATWEKYKVFKINNEETNLPSYLVSLPTTATEWAEVAGVDKGYASVFAIQVFTKAAWNEQPGFYQYLGEKDGYVFAYTLPNSGPDVMGDKSYIQFREGSKAVLESFKITE